MFSGIPELFKFTINLIEMRTKRDSLSIVTYHLLGEIVHAAELALFHYLPLTLDEDFLKNSHIGTPYQKWAKFTNDDFERVTQNVTALIPAVRALYSEISDAQGADEGSYKRACGWFGEVKREYSSCLINSAEPSLVCSAIIFDNFLDTTTGLFVRPERLPLDLPIVAKSVIDISERSVIANLQSVGIPRLEEIRESVELLAVWLKKNYTISDAITSYREPISDRLHCRTLSMP